MNNAERIAKLATKLGAVEAKRSQYSKEYEDIRAEIFSLLGEEAITATKTALTKPVHTKAKAGELSGRITTALNRTPGQNLKELAKSLKTAPQKIGVALWHLGQKKEVYKQNDGYFLAPTVPASKAMPSIDLEEGT